MNKTRIFVANDDVSFLNMMQELLEDEGYEVTVLYDKARAYDEIVESLPDLVILDISLEHPGAGWLILDKLKLNPSTTHLPAIVCSGDILALRQRQQHLTELGCFIIEKPFDLETMLAVIAQALEGRPSANSPD